MITAIRVLVRARPLNARELSQSNECSFKMDETSVTIDEKPYNFDQCISQKEDQERVFSYIWPDITDSLDKSFNYCLFAYGTTGSGKSYTITGDEKNSGIIPKTFQELLNYTMTELSETKCTLIFAFSLGKNKKSIQTNLINTNDFEIIKRILEKERNENNRK